MCVGGGGCVGVLRVCVGVGVGGCGWVCCVRVGGCGCGSACTCGCVRACGCVLVDRYSRVGTNWSTFCVHACIKMVLKRYECANV